MATGYTFRFKIKTPELNDAMILFAELHCYDTKPELKENLNKWYDRDEIGQLVQKEWVKLNGCGYEDNPQHDNLKAKIFRSIKYYHIKNYLKGRDEKQNKIYEKNSEKIKTYKSENKAPPLKFQFSKSFIRQVKSFLIEQFNAMCLSNDKIHDHDATNSNPNKQLKIKPSVCYSKFMDIYTDAILREKARIHTQMLDIKLVSSATIDHFNETFDSKLKKMIKNQYNTMITLTVISEDNA